jgi:energy-coupling factor transport system permease protein
MQTHADVMPRAGAARPRAADPRILLVSVITIIVASMTTVSTIAGMAVLFVLAVAWHAQVARGGATRRAAMRVLPLAALVVLINAVLVPGESLVEVAGHRVISSPGLRDGIFFALRLGTMLMAVSLLISASSAEAMAQGVHDLIRRVSPRAASGAAFFTFLSLGFVPLVADEIGRVRTAQAFRGGRLEGGFARRAATMRMWLVPVLMSAVRRSGQLALAVELRDIRGRLVPSLPPLHVRAADIIQTAVVAAVVVAASWPV